LQQKKIQRPSQKRERNGKASKRGAKYTACLMERKHSMKKKFQKN